MHISWDVLYLILTNITVYFFLFVVVNFDALAQASDFQIERRQVVFLCWMQDLNQGLWNRISSKLNARWQTDWAFEDQAKKLELNSPSLWSASIQPNIAMYFVSSTARSYICTSSHCLNPAGIVNSDHCLALTFETLPHAVSFASLYGTNQRCLR